MLIEEHEIELRVHRFVRLIGNKEVVVGREIPNVFVWILASALGWAAGFWTSQAVLPLFFSDPAIEPALSTTVIAVTTGLVAGAITGIALIWIVRKPELA